MLQQKYVGFFSRHGDVALRVIAVRNYSQQELNTIPNYDISALRKGVGSRSSFNGIIATVFGCTGFLGRSVSATLARQGTQMVYPHRNCLDEEDTKDLRVTGDLGQTSFLKWHLQDYESIKKAVKYSDVVINVVGRTFETSRFSFDELYNVGARNIARACKECGVPRLIHVSHISAQPNPQNKYKWRKYKLLSSKYDGDNAVMEEFPDATIIKPAIMYGKSDYFFSQMNAKQRRRGHSKILPCRGEGIVRQPVFVDDVSHGIYNAMIDSSTKGKIYAAVGPKRYTLAEISDWNDRLYEIPMVTGKDHNRHNANYDLIFTAACMFASAFRFHMHTYKWSLSSDQLEFEAITDLPVPKEMLTLADLGVTNLRVMTTEAPLHFYYRWFYDWWNSYGYINFDSVAQPKECLDA